MITSIETFRIGRTTEYELDCGFGKIVLACKVPACNEHHNFAYADGFFPTEPQNITKYMSSPLAGSKLIYRSLSEARCFEEAATEGKDIPAVTGVIAGFGIIGTISQDVSHGSKYQVEYKDWDHVFVHGENGEKKIVTVDMKKDFSRKSQLDYYFHRLQIDRTL